jgi:hypothetical protein
MSSSPIEELTVPFDPTVVQQKVARRRRMVWSRVVSLMILAVFLAVIYIWRRDQMAGAGVIVVYAAVLLVSVGWLLIYLVGYRRAKRELASMEVGTAVRIARPGVEMHGIFVPWPEVLSLVAVKGGLGESAMLELNRANGEPLTVPFDHMDVRPATLDTTARAYSAGQHGVDLQALDG